MSEWNDKMPAVLCDIAEFFDDRGDHESSDVIFAALARIAELETLIAGAPKFQVSVIGSWLTLHGFTPKEYVRILREPVK